MAKIKKRTQQSQAAGTQGQGTQSESKGPLAEAERFALLQAIMQKRWMPFIEAKELYFKVARLGKKPANWTETVAAINAGLTFLLVELRTITYPVDGEKYVGIVNKEADQVAKENGSTYSIPQIQYLRAIVEQIAVDRDAVEGVGSLSSLDVANCNFSAQYETQATQSQAETKRLSMNEKNAALAMFVNDGWLTKTPNQQGHYSIGVRTFLELSQMLLEFDLPKSTRQVWERLF